MMLRMTPPYAREGEAHYYFLFPSNLIFKDMFNFYITVF